MSDARVLVLGATGMLGHAVVAGLDADFDVYSTVRDLSFAERHGVSGRIHEWDVTRFDVLEEILSQVRPAYVVNCIGTVMAANDAANPALAIAVNSLLPHQLAAACTSVGAQFVHISTDSVFSGDKALPGAYSEQDRPDPTDLYGRSKLLGETADFEGLTLRTSIIGRELGRQRGLLEWFLGQTGRAVDGYAGCWFTGLTTSALTGLLAQLFRSDSQVSGVYHVASEPISKYQLLLRLRDAFGLQVEIRQVSSPKINRTLDGSRFVMDTQIAVPSWSEMIADLARR